MTDVAVFQMHCFNFVPPANEDELWHNEYVKFLELDTRGFLDGQPTTTFALHDACWNILKSCFDEAPIPLDRLAQAIQLRPKQMSAELAGLTDIISHNPSKRHSDHGLRLTPAGRVREFEQRSMDSKGDTFMQLPLTCPQKTSVDYAMSPNLWGRGSTAKGSGQLGLMPKGTATSSSCSKMDETSRDSEGIGSICIIALTILILGHF